MFAFSLTYHNDRHRASSWLDIVLADITLLWVLCNIKKQLYHWEAHPNTADVKAVILGLSSWLAVQEFLLSALWLVRVSWLGSCLLHFILLGRHTCTWVFQSLSSQTCGFLVVSWGMSWTHPPGGSVLIQRNLPLNIWDRINNGVRNNLWFLYKKNWLSNPSAEPCTPWYHSHFTGEETDLSKPPLWC